MKTLEHALSIPYGNAICYSGYRAGQAPERAYPTMAQIREDLLLLAPAWRYLRLYDTSEHASRVLRTIRREGLPFKVMLGAHIAAEVSNDNCPWGGTYSASVLRRNRKTNERNIDGLISMARQYEDIVCCVSVGNEATVDWTDHLVPVSRVISFVQKVKEGCDAPVTFCENYVPWVEKLSPLVPHLDFLSVHTYPLWEYVPVSGAMDFSKENYYSVANVYPDMPVIITEAGWASASNGRGMHADAANEKNQARFCKELVEWSQQSGVMAFVFEAFDEEWKGSADPLEPEKHWGLYDIERKPKAVVDALKPGLEV